MVKWLFDKTVRELSHEIENYKMFANREIENNKVCSPKKVRYSSQNFLKVCLQRYKDFTGKDYK